MKPNDPAAPGGVLIVGGGLVGASLAIALDRLDLDVGLVEVTPPELDDALQRLGDGRFVIEPHHALRVADRIDAGHAPDAGTARAGPSRPRTGALE